MSVPLVVAVELRFLGEKVITDVILKLGFIVWNDWITADLHKGIFVRKNCQFRTKMQLGYAQSTDRGGFVPSYFNRAQPTSVDPYKVNIPRQFR